MKMEVVEPGNTTSASLEPAGICDQWEFFSACCIIHFWGWEPGQGVCC
jgi:hypothetical protein